MKFAFIVATAACAMLTLICSLQPQGPELKRWPKLRWIDQNRFFIGVAALVLTVVCAVLALAEARTADLRTTHDRGQQLALRVSAAAMQQEMSNRAYRNTTAAVAMFQGGERLMENRQFRAAASAFRDSAAHAPTKAALGNLALCLRYHGNTQGALEAAQRAVALPQEATPNGRLMHGNALLQAGISLSDLGERDRASDALEDAYRQFEAEREFVAVAAAQYALAINDFRAGRTSKALRDLAAANSLFGRASEFAGQASTQNAIGVIRLETGETDAGLTILNEAVALFARADDIAGQAGVLLNIASAREDRCELQTALKLYGQSAVFAEQVGDGYLLALANSSSAGVLLEQGDAAAAHRRARAALLHAQGTTVSEDDAWAHLVLGRIFRQETCFKSAADELALAQRKFTKVSITGHLATTLEQARLARDSKELSHAAALLDHAIDVVEDAGYELYRPTIMALRAEILEAEGQPQKAVAMFGMAHQVNKRRRITNCMARAIEARLQAVAGGR